MQLLFFFFLNCFQAENYSESLLRVNKIFGFLYFILGLTQNFLSDGVYLSVRERVLDQCQGRWRGANRVPRPWRDIQTSINAINPQRVVSSRVPTGKFLFSIHDGPGRDAGGGGGRGEDRLFGGRRNKLPKNVKIKIPPRFPISDDPTVACHLSSHCSDFFFVLSSATDPSNLSESESGWGGGGRGGKCKEWEKSQANIFGKRIQIPPESTNIVALELLRIYTAVGDRSASRAGNDFGRQK